MLYYRHDVSSGEPSGTAETAMNGTSEKFQRELKRFRLKALVRHTGERIADGAVFLPAALLLLVALHPLVPTAAIIGVSCLMAAIWLTAWGVDAPLRLDVCARIADRSNAGRSTVVNALELTRRGANTPFACHAIRLGTDEMPRSAVRISHKPMRWKLGMLLILPVLPLFLHNRTFHPPVEERSGSRAAASSPSFMDKADAPRPRHDTAAMKSSDRRSGNPAADMGHGKSGYGRNHDGTTSAAVAGAGGGTPAVGSGDSATSRNSSGEYAAGERKLRTENPAGVSGGDVSGGGEAESGDDSDRNPGGNAASTASAAASGRREHRRKKTKRPRETHGDASRVIFADNTPPAGRKQSEKEEHGDRPGEGRGGETGAKKARGAASALPVVPLPDSVAGRLGDGTDSRAERRAAAGDGGAAECGNGVAGASPEPSVRRGGLTAALRRQFGAADDAGTRIKMGQPTGI